MKRDQPVGSRYPAGQIACAALTAIDWIIVVFVLAMAVWGFAQGLIVGALSLAGFAVGAYIGARIAPSLLAGGSESPYSPLIALLGAILIGGVLAMGLEAVGFHLRGMLGQSLGLVDGAGGAALLAAVGLGFAWILGAVALQTPGARELRRDIQRSQILSALNERLPPSGGFLKALARFDPFPDVRAQVPRLERPDRRIARDPDVRRAEASVVRVLGTACGLGVQGSGWVAGQGLVVTNAHVIAGQDDTTVQVRGVGERLPARAVWFDPRNDLALLRAEALAARPLPLQIDARPGTSAAILGFPQNSPEIEVRAGRLGPTVTALSDDAYGRGPFRRRITTLRGVVRSGNSGGPMVEGRGRVVATIFASNANSGRNEGYGIPDSVVQRALRRARGEVDTGPCAR